MAARAGLTAVVPIGAIVALARVRPLRRVLAVIMGAFVVVLGAWLAIPPSHDRDWQPDMATLPYADIRFPNGYLDELGYENGALDQSVPFAALKARSHINECARAAVGDPRFSVLIRAGLPRMPESSGA